MQAVGRHVWSCLFFSSLLSKRREVSKFLCIFFKYLIYKTPAALDTWLSRAYSSNLNPCGWGQLPKLSSHAPRMRTRRSEALLGVRLTKTPPRRRGPQMPCFGGHKNNIPGSRFSNQSPPSSMRTYKHAWTIMRRPGGKEPPGRAPMFIYTATTATVPRAMSLFLSSSKTSSNRSITCLGSVAGNRTSLRPSLPHL